MKDPRAWEKYLCPHCMEQSISPDGSIKLCMKVGGTCDHGEGFEEKQ